MKITPEQKTKYSAFMQDLWGLIKEFRNPEHSDEYWNDFRDRATEISNKYDNEKFVLRMLQGVFLAVNKEFLEEERADQSY